MKKLILLISVIVLLMALSPTMVLAGSKNMNGENGDQGTEKVNGKDGCQANVHSGDRWVYVPSSAFPESPYYHEWKGGPCCPSNVLASTIGAVSIYTLPNQCCNGPDYLPGTTDIYEPAPGNHCLCFADRGYPDILFPP